LQRTTDNRQRADNAPHILLVNPWIHDFAAYDFWSKPYGLLSLAGVLRGHGCPVSYIDCLDRFHPRSARSDPRARFGRGPFHKTAIAKPAALRDVPRTFSRYGIAPQWFCEDLSAIRPPELVLITGLMTYWYTGLQETVAMLRQVWPRCAIVVGGIYATLCETHARDHLDVDAIVAGPAESRILDIVGSFTGHCFGPQFDPDDLDTWPYPAFDLQRCINYVPILTSRGCPFRCAYCATGILNPKMMRRSPARVVEEISFWHERHAVRDFVFYDDALLVDAAQHAVPMLEGILAAGLPLRFHTPNALHIRNIDNLTAGLMHRAGFETVRLGLETAVFDHRSEMDSKVTAAEFKRAVTCLRKAGFSARQVGAYLLTGLPGQSIDSVKRSIHIVKQSGITPIPAHYSPIPGSALWPEAVAASRYDLTADPIFTNNAIQPCSRQGFDWQTVSDIKTLIEA
jgi:hypothetical protein